ncbi:aldehyde dehydrogenase family protein [Bradyrhizobium sp. SSUT112]|nr:aldehyde dehydrogenase family protein [Bradyrhizobium sp. SSUT112]MDH2357708.1 aldehyde dehydrogenase family protein [Bradyrhizobium sp. SSUT112]
MVHRMHFYMALGSTPRVTKAMRAVNPATVEEMYEVALGSKADIDKAVIAARRAFETFSQSLSEIMMFFDRAFAA